MALVVLAVLVVAREVHVAMVRVVAVAQVVAVEGRSEKGEKVRR